MRVLVESYIFIRVHSFFYSRGLPWSKSIFVTCQRVPKYKKKKKLYGPLDGRTCIYISTMFRIEDTNKWKDILFYYHQEIQVFRMRRKLNNKNINNRKAEEKKTYKLFLCWIHSQEMEKKKMYRKIDVYYWMKWSRPTANG